MSDSVVVVAPRPIRANTLPLQRLPARKSSIAATSDSLATIAHIDGDFPADADAIPTHIRPISASPRSSPRLNLSAISSAPADALEEFLSILRPSIFPPISGPFRSRRHAQSSGPTFPYDRPHPYKSHSKSSSLSSVASDDADFNVDFRPPRPLHDDDFAPEDDERRTDKHWRYTAQHSPVSRVHTRNPFQRHPSYELAFADILTQPMTHTSPSLLPLPPSPPNDSIRNGAISPIAVPLPIGSDSGLDSP